MNERSATARLDAEAALLRGSGGGDVTPRDAATVIVVDESTEMPSVLMGRRSSGHVFMPGRIVFPGGRVDESDVALMADFTSSAKTEPRLGGSPSPGGGPCDPVALALAAIRETFEETGAMIAEPGNFSSASPFWSAFAAKGLRPTPEKLVPFARALTPSGPPRRYDTRFFCVAASALAVRPTPEALPTDELEAVGWFSLAETAGMELAPITRTILEELGTLLDDGSWLEPRRRIPFYRRTEEGFVRELVAWGEFDG